VAAGFDKLSPNANKPFTLRLSKGVTPTTIANEESAIIGGL
jgi:hypothetical protein